MDTARSLRGAARLLQVGSASRSQGRKNRSGSRGRVIRIAPPPEDSGRHLWYDDYGVRRCIKCNATEDAALCSTKILRREA